MKQSFLILFLFSCLLGIAQKTITGTVTDETGEPILGATVQIKGTEKTTTTDFDGNYSIVANEGDVLVFSFAGYKKEEITIKEDFIINVTLEFDFDPLGTIYTHGCSTTSNRVLALYGINYKTTGFKFESDCGVLPYKWNMNFDVGYSTNFKNNTALNFKLGKYIRISKSLSFYSSFKYDTFNFNKSQLHLYKLEFPQLIPLNKVDLVKYLEAKIILGHANINGNINDNSSGIGLGIGKTFYLKDSHLKSFSVKSNLIHYKEFNEFDTSFVFNYRRWRILANYHHVNNYEEFQLGIGYQFMVRIR